MSIVSGAFGVVVACALVREGMHGVAVGDELPIDFRIAHLLFEPLDFLRRHERIVRAMAGEDFSFDVSRVRGSWTAEPAMKAHDPFYVCAAARQFQHRRAAKTIADGRELLWI